MEGKKLRLGAEEDLGKSFSFPMQRAAQAQPLTLTHLSSWSPLSALSWG